MKRILTINGIIESLAGLLLFLRPDLLFTGGTTETAALFVIKLYGILALSFGGLSLVIAKHGENESLKRFATLIVIVFHFLIGFQCYGAYMGGFLPNIGATAFHLVISVIFAGLFLNDKK